MPVNREVQRLEDENRMRSRIAEPPAIPRHENVISWINQLVIDLKLQLLVGEPPHEPITLERLAEWSELRRQLERDVQRWEIKY